MKFYPTRGKVAIKVEGTRQAEGPIIYEEKNNGLYGTGLVASIGKPVIMENGKELLPDFREGQRVAYENRKDFQFFGDFVMMSQSSVVAVLDGETKIG